MLPDMKSYTRILLIIGVVVLVALAVWKGTSKSGTEPYVTVSPSESFAPLASVSPIAIAYDAAPADWKSYASASAGYKVSYPADWSVGPCAPGCTGWAPPTAASGQFALGIIQSAGTIAELLTSAEPYLAAKEEVKAGANTWTKLTLRQPMTGDVITSHFIEHNGQLFEFGTAAADADILKVYGSMIRSFVFTK